MEKYQSPSIEIIDAVVELGFAGSISGTGSVNDWGDGGSLGGGGEAT